MKYKRFVDQIGGWDVLQGILAALADGRAASMASRSPTSRRAGCWSSRRSPRSSSARGSASASTAPTISRSSLSRSTTTIARVIDAALAAAQPHPRRLRRRIPPAALPHRLGRSQPSSRRASRRSISATPVPGRPARLRVDTGSIWEPICGYSRAVRDRRPHPGQRHDGDARQRRDRSARAIRAARPSTSSTRSPPASRRSAAALEDVVRTRIYMRDAAQWEPVARVHGRYFGDVRPANTLVEVSRPDRRLRGRDRGRGGRRQRLRSGTHGKRRLKQTLS